MPQRIRKIWHREAVGMNGFRDLFSSANRGRTALIGAAVAVGAYAAYRAGRAINDYIHPARAHVRDMRAAGMTLDHITPDALQTQRGLLRRTGAVPIPATSLHNHISLERKAGQGAGEFTDFMVDSRRALHTIASQPQGQGLLDRLDSGPNFSLRDMHSRVTISDARYGPQGFNAAAGNGARAEGPLNSRESLSPASTPGLGEASRVFFNPVITRSDGHRPAFIGLAHELVHADRNQHGQALDRQGVNGIHALKDELETVGLIAGPQPVSENTIRAEHNIAPRTAYAGQTRATYAQLVRTMQQQQQQQKGGGAQ
jgi:Effector protein